MRRTSLVIGVFVLALVVVLAGCSFGKDDPVSVSSDGNSVVGTRAHASRSELHDIDLSQPVATLHEATGQGLQ